MKIGFICDTYLPFSTGGAEKSIHSLACSLARENQRIVVIVPRFGRFVDDFPKEVRIRSFPFPYKPTPQSSIPPFIISNIFSFLYSIFWIAKIVRAERVKIMHVHGKYLLPSAVIVHMFLRLPIVVTLRDYVPLCPFGLCLFNRGGRVWSMRRFFQEEFPMYIRHYVHSRNPIVVMMNVLFAARGWIISRILFFSALHSNIRIYLSSAQRAIYIRNGMGDGEVIGNIVQMSRGKRSRREDFHLLFAGRLTYGKGVRLIIEAMPSVLRQYPNCTLHIAGLGPDEGVLMNRVSQLGLRPHVVFHGFLFNAELYRYMAEVDGTIIPSIWPEPFGRVAVESLLSGTPVIVSNRGGLKDIVEDRKTGIIIPPTVRALSNAIRIILTQNASYRKNVYKERAALSKRFGQEIVARHILLYQKVLQQ